MKTIHFATTNEGKLTSLTSDFASLSVDLVAYKKEIHEIQANTVEEVATDKVMQAYQALGAPCIAQDGGIFIEALEGFPGVYAKYVLQTIGMEGILKLLKDTNSTVSYRDTYAYMDETLEVPVCFSSATCGSYIQESRGRAENAFGSSHHYFVPEGHDKTFAEMNFAEQTEWKGGQSEPWCGIALAQWLEKHLGS